LPGEEALPNAKITSGDIWPWLTQMGADRGGFYSYAWLKNLVGCQLANTAEIRPELQNLKQGDRIYLHPKTKPLKVTHLEQNRVLALEGWILYLRPISPTQTRLITRTCAFTTPKEVPRTTKLINTLCNSVAFDLAHFIMRRKQLLEIKHLVERQTGKFHHHLSVANARAGT
jgi:hypothetical protein